MKYVFLMFVWLILFVLELVVIVASFALLIPLLVALFDTEGRDVVFYPLILAERLTKQVAS